jgi:predicted dehydrogenase
MDVLDVGIVGLDTTHARRFAETLEGHYDTRLVAAHPGRAIRDDGSGFREDYGCRVVDELTEMVDLVDCAMVLSVDWDAHAEQALAFTEAGLPVSIDKPIAGKLEDVEALADAGAPVTGGSIMVNHPDVAAFPSDGTNRSLFANGYYDPFYYGAHVVEIVRSLVDADWAAVEPMETASETVEVAFEDGTHAAIDFDGPSENVSYGLLDVRDDGVETTTVDNQSVSRNQLDRQYVEAFVDVVRGDRAPPDRVLDAGSLLLATDLAMDTGETVRPDDEALANHQVDGAAFAEDYAERV